MATYDKTGQMTYVDESGNEHLLYPNTKMECVEGLEAQLASKAPAGYGLGENLPADIDHLALANRTGWFRSNEGMESFGLTPGWWFGNYIPYGDNEGVWELNHYLDGLKANIRKVNGVLQPAEWVNPPMDFNVEYRTTKRYNGIPVYTKLIRFGNAPNNATKDVQWAEAGEISLVMNCTCFSGDGIYIGTGELSGVWYTANKIHLYAMTKSDLSAETLFFILEYCKA
jgi:hypothetical protein